MDKALIILYLVAILVIGFLLYTMTNNAQNDKIIKVRNELPPPQRFNTHWWGYGWRPWWRRYGGVPGFERRDSLPEPKIPVAPKPIVINTKPILY